MASSTLDAGNLGGAPQIAVHRVILPREHGAIAFLLVPLSCALAFGRPDLPAIALVLAAISGLLGHEPLMVVLGHRGLRVFQQHRALATAVVTACGIVAATGLTIAIAALRHELSFIFAPLMLSAAVLALAIRRRERSTAGEILAAAALSSWCVPLARLLGAAPRAAWLLGAGFIIAFALATLGVRSIIAAHRRKPNLAARRAAVATALLAFVLLFASSAHGAISSAFEHALWPAEAFALLLALANFSPRHLMKLGVANLGVSLLVAAMLFFALRG